ncbi:MAG: hypothetical protein KAI47_20120, partial [Deltaproteobacteria bacterium]|nr:hypothetical protein [Deltaproteobacteria bacterium]
AASLSAVAASLSAVAASRLIVGGAPSSSSSPSGGLALPLWALLRLGARRAFASGAFRLFSCTLGGLVAH